MSTKIADITSLAELTKLEFENSKKKKNFIFCFLVASMKNENLFVGVKFLLFNN